MYSGSLRIQYFFSATIIILIHLLRQCRRILCMASVERCMDIVIIRCLVNFYLEQISKESLVVSVSYILLSLVAQRYCLSKPISRT